MVKETGYVYSSLEECQAKCEEISVLQGIQPPMLYVAPIAYKESENDQVKWFIKSDSIVNAIHQSEPVEISIYI